MKKKLLLLFFISVFRLTNAFSQGNDNLSSFIPAVSQNIGLTGGIKNVNTDYYSGRLSYNSPLNNVNIYGINFPISLNYSTTGVKVQDVPGVTGLGWTSSLGGEITREVHGIPDDWYYGYSGTDRTGGKNYGALNQDYVNKVSAGTWDSQPDKFYFSFLGFTGSFVMDPDGKPVLLSNQTGIKIESCPFKRGQTLGQSWILRDQKGNRYFFEVGQMMTNLVHQAQQNQYQIYTSAWYITKIITAANQQIDFTYVSGGNITYTSYLNIRRVDQQQNGNLIRFDCLGSKHTADTTYNQNIDINYQPYYLAKISGNGTNINLAYNMLRTDLNNGKALTDISINYNNRATNSYKLNYNYFNSTDGTNTKRLKLSSIAQVYPGNVSKVIYNYYYNETVNLPARNSVKTDYLGYYNSNTQTSNISGFADKTPNLINSQANILQKVSDIFGGSVNFEYELNNYYSVSSVSNLPAAGLRVKKFYEKKSDADAVYANQYTISYNLPGSTQTSGQLYGTFLPFLNYSYYVICGTKSGSVYYNSSEPLESIIDDKGVFVGYSLVTVSRSDGSLTRFSFTNYSEYPDKYATFSYSSYNTSPIFNNSDQTSAIYHYGPATSYSFARGKLLKEELIDAGGQPVKITTNSYSLTNPVDLVVGLTVQLYSTENNNYNINGFTYSTQDLRLNSKTVQFLKAGVNQQSTTENFTYASYAPNLPQSVTFTGSSGRSDKVTFRYPFDIIPTIPSSAPSVTLPLTYMVYNNIIVNPVEVIHSVIRNGQSKVVSANITKYGANDYNIIAPLKELKSEFKYPVPENEYVTYKVAYSGSTETETTDSRLKPFKLYSKYNTNTNITEEQTATAPATLNAYIYGYNNSYQTAVANNTSLNNVAYTSFESNDKGNWAYNGNPVFDLSSITGTKYYNISKGAITKSNLASATSYIITYWTKNSTYYTIAGTQGTPALLAARNGWRCYQHTVKNLTSITIAGTGFIDELRLFPAGARITTATYDPFIGMTSKNDENNQITYYNYDEFNRLQYIRDNDRNILQAYCYNFNGEPGNCFTTVTNQPKSGSFYKLDCGPGILGFPVTYSVPAGRYSADSQQAADGLAQVEIDQNGQEYANANGTCSALTLYARIETTNFTNDSWSSENGEGGSSSIADVYIKFYSDSQCTTAYAPDRPITVVVTEGFNLITAYNGSSSGASNASYTVPANQSSLFLGRHLLSSYGSYIDPYSGSGLIYESNNYTYDVLEGSNQYIPSGN